MDIRDKIVHWNNQFPVDYWWRKKHNIPFMSQQHRQSNFWDQLFEYKEDVLISSLNQKSDYKMNENQYLTINDDVDLKSIPKNEEYALKELEKFKKT